MEMNKQEMQKSDGTKMISSDPPSTKLLRTLPTQS